MNIFVTRLNYDTDEETVRSLFEQYGTVDSAKIIFDKFTGRSKGYAFVEMSDKTAGNQAIAALNDTEVDGRTIVVKEAEPRPERERGNFNRR